MESPSGEEVSIPEEWNQYFYPDFIPQGYTTQLAETAGANKLIVFRDITGNEIQFLQAGQNSNFQIDTENAAVEEISVLGNKAILVEKNGQKTLLWYNSEGSFLLTGVIDSSDILGMAESIRIVKK